MNFLLKISKLIDALNERIGRALTWLVLIAVLVSATNAVVRKAFDFSSNAFLEAQWYMFSAIFLLGAGYTLLHNEHIRIDIIAGKFSKRVQTWIDILGTLFFLFPVTFAFLWYGSQMFAVSFMSKEMSPNAGGLIVWPVKMLIPLGFFLLALQGFSELVKRIAFLKGLIPDPSEKHAMPTAEEELLEELRKRQEEEKKNG
jgi:TRAP-type mannitol/chloroaromatic compound transport system permease small subunit